jgi:cysteine sulfinate desulfinase/cysteine desulfurase-like protein
MKTEHKAVLDTMRELERQGFEVTYLDPEPDGLLDLEKFKAALPPDTIVVSIMHVNNEIGVIQPIDRDRRDHAPRASSSTSMPLSPPARRRSTSRR